MLVCVHALQITFTAELGSALALAKVTPQVNGNTHFGVWSPKNY